MFMIEKNQCKFGGLGKIHEQGASKLRQFSLPLSLYHRFYARYYVGFFRAIEAILYTFTHGKKKRRKRIREY